MRCAAAQRAVRASSVGRGRTGIGDRHGRRSSDVAEQARSSADAGPCVSVVRGRRRARARSARAVRSRTCGLLSQQRLRAQHELALVEQRLLGEHAVVGEVELRRTRARASCALVVGGVAPPSPRTSCAVIARLLEPVDPRDDAGEHRGRAAAEVVQAHVSSSMRSSSIASRSAADAVATNGSRPASIASSCSSRAQKPGTVWTCSSSKPRSSRASMRGAQRAVGGLGRERRGSPPARAAATATRSARRARSSCRCRRRRRRASGPAACVTARALVRGERRAPP